MASPTAYGQARWRVERICGSVNDARTLRLRLLDEIRQVVAFDAYAWLLTDPETSVGTAPLADVPCLSELPRLIRLRYLSEVSRWTVMDGVGVVHLPADDGRRPAEARSWSDFLAGHGVSDVATVVFDDRYGCWGWLDLWRSPRLGRFDPAEVAFLTDFADPVTSALRRCQASTFVVRRPGSPRPAGPVVLVLSPDLEVLRRTPQSHEYLRALVPPERGLAPVPANAYNVAAQLLALEAGVDANPAVARVHMTGGLWVTMRAARLGDDGAVGEPDIAVTIEDSSPAERIAVFARSFGFSPRETELLRHLVAGLDTRGLARRMFVSEHTIQDYLKVIFAKTSERNRRGVVSRALGG